MVAAYFGSTFSGRVPWSFWQTYKRVTGSPRSNSSLYHHWNGVIHRKYENFVSSGRLGECIACIERVTGPERKGDSPPAGSPLVHHRSVPPVALGAPRALVRNASHAAEPCAFPLFAAPPRPQ
jgi:hypothetical protein